jgi:hypothetical protein
MSLLLFTPLVSTQSTLAACWTVVTVVSFNEQKRCRRTQCVAVVTGCSLSDCGARAQNRDLVLYGSNQRFAN